MNDIVRGPTTPARILALAGSEVRAIVDDVATEEPLEIRLLSGGATRTLAVTMRTPGSDFELAAGFLLSEGAVERRDELIGISYCTDPQLDGDQRYNVVNVTLSTKDLSRFEALERHFVISSACGVCGKAGIDALRIRAQPIDDPLKIDAAFIASLPEKMRGAQRAFASTGGLHAAALFDKSGKLIALREDVGRHNALDKIVGWALLHDRIPLRGCVLLVSGRASYELLQKSIVAGIPVICAVSAPSSLAVELAQAFGVTLAGFVRAGRANVYAGGERITSSINGA